MLVPMPRHTPCTGLHPWSRPGRTSPQVAPVAHPLLVSATMSEPIIRTLRAITGGRSGSAASALRPRSEDLDDTLARLDEVIAVADLGSLPLIGLALSARLLTAAEAAQIAGVSRRWIYIHTRGMKFRRNLSRKSIRLEEMGFRRWLEYQRP